MKTTARIVRHSPNSTAMAGNGTDWLDDDGTAGAAETFPCINFDNDRALADEGFGR
jgi:hypothetical protein